MLLLPCSQHPGLLPCSRAGSSPTELGFNAQLEVSKSQIQPKGLMMRDGPLQRWIHSSNRCSQGTSP